MDMKEPKKKRKALYPRGEIEDYIRMPRKGSKIDLQQVWHISRKLLLLEEAAIVKRRRRIRTWESEER